MSKLSKDLSQLSREELLKKVDALRVELVNQKKARHAGELMNPNVIKKTRRSIAVALTFLSKNDTAVKKEEA